MNPIALSKTAAFSIEHSMHSKTRNPFWFRVELAVIVSILALLNWPLLQGLCNSSLIFLPGPALDGEWWRWLTHPFIHVTWYHLLLDGIAFFMLYRDLKYNPWMKRFAYVAASGAGSLFASLWADPMISMKGLCGLSGVAHGLMAISALDLMSQKQDKILFRAGFCCFVLVLLKSLIEVLTGKMLFPFLYFDMVGDPVTVTHAGGVIGGLVVWWSIWKIKN